MKESGLLLQIFYQRLIEDPIQSTEILEKHENTNDLTNIFLDLRSEYLEKDARNTLQAMIDEINFESDNKTRIQLFYVLMQESVNKYAIIKLIKSVILERGQHIEAKKQGCLDVAKIDCNKMSLEHVQEVCNAFHISVKIKTEVKKKEQNFIKRPNQGFAVIKESMLYKSKVNLIYSPTRQYLLYSKTFIRETGIEDAFEAPVSFELTPNLEQYYSSKFQIRIPELLFHTENKIQKLEEEITERNVKITENEDSINQLKETNQILAQANITLEEKHQKVKEENLELRTQYQDDSKSQEIVLSTLNVFTASLLAHLDNLYREGRNINIEQFNGIKNELATIIQKIGEKDKESQILQELNKCLDNMESIPPMKGGNPVEERKFDDIKEEQKSLFPPIFSRIERENLILNEITVIKKGMTCIECERLDRKVVGRLESCYGGCFIQMCHFCVTNSFKEDKSRTFIIFIK